MLDTRFVDKILINTMHDNAAHPQPPQPNNALSIEQQIELCKLEYEQATQRYENIYKAIWQIFSYMAILTGAILTFGSSKLPLVLVALIGPFPLVFWYLAIFIPMDRYGQLTKKRLKEIEEKINTSFLEGSGYELGHYTQFAVAAPPPPEEQDSRGPRVSDTVKKFIYPTIFFWSLFLIFAIYATYTDLTNVQSKPTSVELKSPVQVQTQDPQIQEFKKELTALSTKLDSIEALLRQRTTDVPAQKPSN